MVEAKFAVTPCEPFFLYLASEGCIAPLGACPVCLAGVGGPHTHRTGTLNAVLVLVLVA